MKLHILSGGSIGLLLGLLMGLSASPVVALVVGALAALLSSLVIPQPKSAATDTTVARQRDAGIRATALGITAIVGVFLGLWIRTHNLLSPEPASMKEQVDRLVAVGFSPEEARRLVASKEFPAATSSSAPAAAASGGSAKPQSGSSDSKAADPKSTALFKVDAQTCQQIAPSRFKDVATAAAAYEAAGHLRLARIARGLVAAVPTETERESALKAVTEAICAGE